MCSPNPWAIVTLPRHASSGATLHERQLIRRPRMPRKLPSMAGTWLSASEGMVAHLDLHRRLLGAGVLDLERRVRKPEALSQKQRERPTYGVAVVSRVHDHVGRDRRKAGGHLPDVQVMHLADAGLGG